ncbi:hypothetical protein PQJ75_11565 [Rhodoplanes sp. TEM]|uniref:Hydrolase n=1 Tax=Rhodoplanes tepidamans TaxID=200616 RepID=A0ABT5JJX2_RHOTP|nr:MULTISPECIES: hypothetical protein [Rhodoplanes]MDC7790000.1 hypothetical protein [Rhodoplanes tepidamans]MDC7984369.1 hypothetical protein [Rhodoplanes sp. TEM]MDQ0358361.1 FMN phosphatase YigB (HAD superfamily) [Rhodoplanes tepidamans]
MRVDERGAAALAAQRAPKRQDGTAGAATAAGGTGGPAAAPRTGAAFSFDVFDTVLMRRCTAPDGVFELTARHVGADVARPGLVESFVQHRRFAETTARKRSKTDGRDGEVTIEEIWAEFPRRLFGLSALSPADLAEAEFQAELDLCFADPDVAFLYDAARAEGLRTGFVSDTYWDGERLARLLRHCRPGLAWDFLYASCDHGTGKTGRLFERVLATEGLAPGAVTHMGDNPAADVLAPRRLGIGARPYAQATAWLAGVLQREDTVFDMAVARSATGRRLDGGLRTMRRRIARTTPATSPAGVIGTTVLGPVMAGFDRFVLDRVERLEAAGGRVAVAFLARDGALSHALWTRLHPDRPAAYVEVNRRTASLSCADGPGGFDLLLGPIEEIDHPTAVDMLAIDAPALHRFFARAGGVTDGRTLAAALPELFGRKVIADLAGGMRDGLLAHLRREIPDFDAVTDLVLVDLGYSGTVQRGLRRALDLAFPDGGPRLHGLYLIGRDSALERLAPDNAESTISDLVVTPEVKSALMGNVAVLEQLCAAPTASVRSYRDGLPVRESEHRDPAQVALTTEIRAAALDFATALAADVAEGRPDPLADVDTAVAWTAATLCRLMLLPTDDEVVVLGSLSHDINLGSRTTLALADPLAARHAALTKALPDACLLFAPTMWPAGSLASLSPAHGFAYALLGSGLLPGDVFGDVDCGRVTVTVVDQRQAATIEVACARTASGDIRLRIPMRAESRIQAVGVPVGRIAPRALLRGVALQQGKTGTKAVKDGRVTMLGADRVQAVGATLVDDVFKGGPEGSLLVLMPPLADKVGVVTVLLTPLGGARPLALGLHDQIAASAPPA